MATEIAKPDGPRNARDKLLDAALSLVRQNGFNATSVDDLCKRAGVTKGAFFHHFVSKDELGVAACHYWSSMTGGLFAGADYHHHVDPLDRIMGYLDLRAMLLEGQVSEFTCFAGTMLQETHLNDALRTASFASIAGHTQTLEADFAEAIRLHGQDRDLDAASLALHTQVVLQGAFIIAKGEGVASSAHASIDHLRRYLAFLFSPVGD